jgi:hypothetical protein
MNYVIYSLSNGRILRNIFCLEVDLPLQFNPSTESYLTGYLNDSKYYVANGQAFAIPPQPYEYYVFNWDTKQWYDPRTNDSQWVLVKNQRDALLGESDWTQLADVVLTNKDQWTIYRQELRNITTQSDPFNIIWPSKPE